MTTERLSGLDMMNIHYEKPIDYDAVVQIFAEKYRRMLLIDQRLWRNTKLKIDKNNAVYFYHSFLNANLHRCYAAIIVIFWCKKNGIFTLKKWDIKTRWRCLKMAEIAFPRTWNFKIFQGRMLPDPRSQIPDPRSTRRRPPFIEPLMLKPRSASGRVLSVLSPYCAGSHDNFY